jgi:hypothetical protein
VDSSEIAHQSIGDDLSSAAEVIPNDQTQHLSTLGRLMQHPNVTVGSVGAVAVNHGDGKGGCFDFGHGSFCFDVISLQHTQAVQRPHVDQFGECHTDTLARLNHGQTRHTEV